MKISLALSGGAARGAFHLGVLQALEENNMEIVAISGSSIGAIIGTSYAAGVSPKEQLEIFQSKAFKKAFKFNNFKNGFFRIDRQKEILKALVPIENIEDTDIKLHITAIDLESGRIVRFTKGKAIPLCIASATVVPFFKPIAYEGYQLVDGGGYHGQSPHFTACGLWISHFWCGLTPSARWIYPFSFWHHQTHDIFDVAYFSDKPYKTL